MSSSVLTRGKITPLREAHGTPAVADAAIDVTTIPGGFPIKPAADKARRGIVSGQGVSKINVVTAFVGGAAPTAVWELYLYDEDLDQLILSDTTAALTAGVIVEMITEGLPFFIRLKTVANAPTGITLRGWATEYLAVPGV